MGAHLRRTIAAAVALAGALAGVLIIAAPASADEADCAGSHYASGSYELFDVEDQFVPPPLRGSGWDCASRTSDRDFDETPAAAQYSLMWVDIEPSEALDVLARFQDAGWIRGDEMMRAENSAGRAESDRMGVAELREWDPLPGMVGIRFGNRMTGDDIIWFQYTDGVVADSMYTGIADRGVLLVEVITGEAAYGATGASDPSALSGLRTMSDAMPSTTQTAVLGGTAVFLTLLVGLPGFLVDTVLEKRWARLTAWMRARRPATPAPPPSRVRRPAPSWLVWPGFAAASLIACFVDPTFGFNPMSARLYLTMFVSLALVNVVGWFVASAVIRRLQPESRPRIVFRWGSLVLVAVAVVIGRLLEFEPGAVFGLVAGLTFAVSLAASRDALVILIGSGAALALSLLAWVGYSLVAPVAESAGDNVLLRAVTELFSGVVVEGVSTLPLALLPLLALDGAVIFAWRRWVWALAYAGGAAAFVLVMLTLPDAWGEVSGDYLHWVGVFVGFAAFAVALWGTDLFFERRTARRAVADVP